MHPKHIIDFNLQIVLHSSCIDVFKDKRVQSMIFPGFGAELISGGCHVFLDGPSYPAFVMHHDFTGSILFIIQVYVNRKTRQIKNGEIDCSAPFKCKAVGKERIALKKSKNVYKPTYFFKRVTDKAQFSGLSAQMNPIKWHHDLLLPCQRKPASRQVHTASTFSGAEPFSHCRNMPCSQPYASHIHQRMMKADPVPS